MKPRYILFKVLMIIVVLSISVPAGAASVSWSTQEYTIYGWAAECCQGDGTGESYSMSGPPLPLSNSANYSGPFGYYASAGSTITDSYMAAGNGSNHAHSQAGATFLGTFTANDPYFIFSYGYQYSGSFSPGAGITITDLTTGSTLLGHAFNGSNVLYVPTAYGHEIQVDFGIDTAILANSSSSGELTSYSMAVVPEPISSILFVAGGTLLAGRRFKRRKA